MASNFNSEFNYRYQVIGSTPWEKLKQLQNFLAGRKQAGAMEEVCRLKFLAKLEHLKHLETIGALPHVILDLQAEILEMQSYEEDAIRIYKINRTEIAILQKLIAELYDELEPTRLMHEDGTPYSDDEMFEANANNEFTVMIGRDIQAEILTYGKPSPAKLLNAMSNPQTLKALASVGLVPEGVKLLQHTDLPLQLTHSYGQPYSDKLLPAPLVPKSVLST